MRPSKAEKESDKAQQQSWFSCAMEDADSELDTLLLGTPRQYLLLLASIPSQEATDVRWCNDSYLLPLIMLRDNLALIPPHPHQSTGACLTGPPVALCWRIRGSLSLDTNHQIQC